ncbi:MAG TPA: MerR family transcriptional regulator [Bryobacteraceae bacterium]|nr:MerR family transcriptional regulator [Bryobacteraceae bacterium]
MSTRDDLSGFYQIHEFAELAGVTIKALHHYDRLGLLKPRRTDAGYRIYAERDLERLEQIIALKFLGVPLKQIKAVLDRAALELPEALRSQRKALEERQALLGRAIRAVRAAEEALEPGKPADPAILKRIIEVIDVQNEVEMMKQYYSTEEAWEKRRRYYEEGPSEEWQKLYRDVRAALGEDPASGEAQALADRWLELSIRAWTGDPAVQTDSGSAWLHRDDWPPTMKRRIAEFGLEEITAFIQQAALCARKKYFSAEAWAKVVANRMASKDYTPFWQARVDLFRDVASSLGEDPAGEKARSLAARWLAQLDQASYGDAAVKAGLIEEWKDRRNWSATVRWREEGLAMMNTDQFERVADFIDRVVAFSIPARTEASQRARPRR